MEKSYDLMEALESIDPRALDYQQWLNVGMALHFEGFDCEVWDSWSAADADRYHPGECQRKWRGFSAAANAVRGGSLVQLAKSLGWDRKPRGRELDWGAEIGGDPAADENRAEVREPEVWDPVQQLIAYLETLFEAGENVGYVTHSYKKDGRYLPDRGCWDRTAGGLIEKLSRCGGDIGSVLGDYNPEAGAWIRFNPLDGKGVKNENVTDFRYALVESDTMDVAQQNAVIRALELPVAALVHSGKKSLHAIVKIDAADYAEYRKRVDYLYGVCKKNGLQIDPQNRNPSRLSRMPGVMRGKNKQFLLGVNMGKGSFAEWKEWIEATKDELPDPENLSTVWEAMPELSPPLIEGVLRQGHKLLLAGPSKAGKSFALIELCCAIAEGREWLGFPCAKGRVLYVNLELDRASCLHRFQDVYAALDYPPKNLGNIDVWNLRGRSVPMDQLAPKLIRRAKNKNYLAVVIDPIYKIITGDENAADQMARFCNQFDKVCTELDCAVIYCHHHSKGAQAGKRSMDRASGSGVFARDPDALLDLLELEVPEDLRVQAESESVCRLCSQWLKRFGKEGVSLTDGQNAALELCRRELASWDYEELLRAVQAARLRVRCRTAWRLEGTLREFPLFAPVELWFDHPVHRKGNLCAGAECESPRKSKGRWAKKSDKLENAFEAVQTQGKATVLELMEYLGISRNTVKNYIENSDEFTICKGVVKRKEVSKMSKS